MTRLTAAEAARGPVTDKWQYLHDTIPYEWRDYKQSYEVELAAIADVFLIRLVTLETPSPTKE